MPVPRTMWSGNQRPTSAARAGWVTAMPAPMTAVAARRPIASGAAARSPLPTAVNANPVMTARVTPSRATSREPTSAAAAKRMMGRPVSIPISVPERLNSLRSTGMTGGTARRGVRSALPTSQRRASAVRGSRDFAKEFLCSRFFLGRFTRPLFCPKWAPPAARSERTLHRGFESLARLGELRLTRLGLCALLALAFDHLLGSALDEVGIAELLLDAGDVGFSFRHFLFEPRALGHEVDDTLERQGRDLAAYDKLHRPWRRRIGERDVGDAGEALHDFRPPARPLAGLGRSAGEHQRQQRDGGDIHFRPDRADR